jgi:hypothetical protein
VRATDRRGQLVNRLSDARIEKAAFGVRRAKAALSSGCKSYPATAPAGSNRSSHGRAAKNRLEGLCPSKTDPGVIPADEECEKARITVVRTGFQHNDMRDTGPDEAKESIQGMLDKFIEDDSPLKPVTTNAPPLMTDAGPVAPYVPVGPTPEMGKRVGSALPATVAAQQ